MLRRAVDFAGIGFYVYRFDGTIVFMDLNAIRIFGIEKRFPDPSAVVGKNIAELIRHKLPVGTLRDRIRKEKQVRQLEVPFKTLDGIDKHVRVDCYFIRDPRTDEEVIEVVMQDVTDLRKMEAELQKASKLESISILASGIAHDFNNILTVIMGNTSLAMMSLKPDDPAARSLAQAEKACLSAKGLTEQLLTFAKGGAPVTRAMSLAQLITESAGFVLRGSNVKCSFRIAEDLWAAEVDAGQFSRVIDNLVINAVQAMPAGGAMVIRAENVTVADRRRLPMKPGPYVRISVEDRGTGMAPEVLAKVFDPFFTTKAKGSGLGLTICYSIVTRHGGYLSAESEAGKGSTFCIHLPASERQPEAADPKDVSALTGRGRILLMDDEALVRDVASNILLHLGYEVECAEDGEEAIEKYRRALDSDRPFDAVVMDLTVPGGLGGKDAVARLLQIDPRVVALASSGYSHDPIMADPAAYGFKGSLSKPYTTAELGRALQKLLAKET
jgi:signal transduction histidine kinase/CheY-like chemotaxis protein